jgi:hypothetical protein
MSELPSKLNQVLEGKDCSMPEVVKLLVKQWHISETEIKRMLFKLGLHKLKPNEDDSIEYPINVSDSEIIKDYLLNHNLLDAPYQVKPPWRIKWEKSVLINWLRSKQLEIPSSWKSWIQNDYPILEKHGATALLDNDEKAPPEISSTNGNKPESGSPKSKQEMYSKWCEERDVLLGSGVAKYFKSAKVPNESEIARTIAKQFDVSVDHVRRVIRNHCK